MKVLGIKMTVKNMIILFLAALGVVYVLKCCCDQGIIGMERMSCGKKNMYETMAGYKHKKEHMTSMNNNLLSRVKKMRPPPFASRNAAK
jgi:hypothetical protein